MYEYTDEKKKTITRGKFLVNFVDKKKKKIPNYLTFFKNHNDSDKF